MALVVFKKCLAITTIIGLLSCPIMAFADDWAPFTDVDKTNHYVSYIQNLKQKGVIDGKEDGMFAPHDSITRAEFIKMVVVGFQLPLDHGHFHFFDLNWAAQYIQTSWNHRIIEGTDDDKLLFSPDSPITREEAAVIVWRLLQAKGVKPSDEHFTLPNTLNSWAMEGVTQCLAKNLFGVPFPSTTFQDPLSREQAAALIDLSLKTSTDNVQSILYENTAYNFILKLPKSWEGKYDVVDRENQAGHNLQFINKATTYGILFTISVWSKEYWSANQQDISGNIPISKIGEEGNNVYVFHTPTDMQYDPSDEKLKADYQNMFNDVKTIKTTFNFKN